jgi:YD repeat-containing protein
LVLGQLTEERHPLGYKKTIERDSFGRVTKVVEIDGKETYYSYTSENRLAAISESGSTWTYEYDPDGQQTRLLKDGATWQKTEREKIAATGGEILKQTDAKGDETVIQFDKAGNMVKQVDALGQKTSYKHDALGQLTGWEVERGAAADLQRDAEGRIASVDTGSSAKLEMAYDLTGRIRKRNNGDQDIQYRYDREGRLTQIDYGKGQTIDYTYDKYGRIETALTGQGVKTTYTWDALDRKSSERNDIPGGGYTLLKWTYTPTSLKKSVSVWRGDLIVPFSINPSPTLLQETGYQYDLLNRYTQISVNNVPKIWYDYDKTTLQLITKRFFNNWIVRYETHSDGHPKSIVATDDKGKTITDCHYVWSPDGKLQTRILNGILHEYKYDPLGRLTEVNKSKAP